jgi:WD40 repeat protein
MHYIMCRAALCYVLQSIPHGLLDINCLHSMPSQQQLVVTCCHEPQIYLFDLQQQAELLQQQQQGSMRSGSDSEDDKVTASGHSGDSAGGGCSKPPPEAVAAVLGGRGAGGYALEWNPTVPGLLLAADISGGVQLYDVQRGSSSSSSSGRAEVQPLQVGRLDKHCAVPYKNCLGLVV